MEITRRNVQRNYKRNHDIVALGGLGSVKGGITDLPPLNFLPATQNSDGTYTVDVSRVNFKGSVVSDKEISAYGLGTGGDTPKPTGSGVGQSEGEGKGEIFNSYKGDVTKNTATGMYSHAEGFSNKALGIGSHSEGNLNTSQGESSHTEGRGNTTIGKYSHAEGYKTLSNNDYEHAEGVYNKSNTSTISSIGIGSSYNDRKNAFEVFGNGNVYVYGLNGYDGTNPSEKNTLQTALKNFDKTDLWTKKEITPENWNLVLTNNHKHDNKEVLDGIKATDITNWNLAFTNNHKHDNKDVIDGIKATDITNWNLAFTNNHTHENKDVIDGIKASDITNWNGKLDKTVWDKAFYYDDLDNIHVKLNLIGDKEVSAYGIGESSTGAITIIDSLNSTAIDAALSANQGRVLKELIDQNAGQSGNLENYYTKTETQNYLNSTAVNRGWDEAVKKSHTHSNKSILDNLNAEFYSNYQGLMQMAHKHDNISFLNQINQTFFDNFGEVVSKKHVHSNLSALNQINQQFLEATGEAISKKHMHSNLSALNQINQPFLDAAGEAISKKHMHSNLSALNQINQQFLEATGDAISKKHVHSNFLVLNQITQPFLDEAGDAISKKHNHKNKSLLDSITNERATGWDTAFINTHIHGNKDVIDSIQDTDITNWNLAFTNNHTHSNKGVLDGIKTSDIINWNGKLDKTVWDKAFYFDANNNIHAKLNLVGDKEVSSYGIGESSTGTFTIIDSLNSTAVDAALSANQGRVLKELIDQNAGQSGNLDNYYNKEQVDAKLSTKSNTNHKHSEYLQSKDLKTVNGQSLIGAGDIVISGGGSQGTSDYNQLINKPKLANHVLSGNTDLKTINGESLIGTGNIVISSGSTGTSDYNQLSNRPALNGEILTSLSKLKTINGKSLLGSGNITIEAAGGSGPDLSAYWSTSDFTSTDVSHWNTAYSNSHSHSNKSILDGITSTKVSNWNTAYSNSHSHSNKGTLDGITSTKVSHWDTAWNNEHTHNNKGTLDGITSTEVSHWNTAWNNEHTHNNKGTLDGISSSDVSNWNGKVNRSGDTMSGTLTINADVKPNNVVVKSGGSIYGGSTELMMCSTTGMTIYQDMDGDGYWNISSVGEAYFNGNVKSDGEITAYSDRRKKSNIKPLENRGYIQPVTYTKDGKQSIGFIAQDVQKLYPELVIEDNSKEKYLSLNYQQYTAVLQAQIIELKKEIEELKNKLN